MLTINEKKVTDRLIKSDADLDELATELLNMLSDSPTPNEEVELHKVLYLTSRKNQKNLSPESPGYYKRKYIDSLMEMGWNLKNQEIRSNQDAKNAFTTALQIENFNPLAHYRLGHITAKSYNLRSEALISFIRALEQNQQPRECKYKLSEAQSANANGMAIQFFIETIDMQSIEIPEEQMKNFQSSIHAIQDLVRNVSNQVVIHLTKKGQNNEETYLTHERYLELKDHFESDSSNLVIDLADEQSSISLSQRAIRCDPCTIYRLLSILKIDRPNTADPETVVRNTLSKQISRLRKKLRSIPLEESMFRIIIPTNGVPQYETSLTIQFFKNIFE